MKLIFLILIIVVIYGSFYYAINHQKNSLRICNGTFNFSSSPIWQAYTFTCLNTLCTYTHNGVPGTLQVFGYSIQEPSINISIPPNLNPNQQIFILLINCTTSPLCIKDARGVDMTIPVNGIFPELVSADDAARFYNVTKC